MTFSGQLYFWRSYFFTPFQGNYFDTTSISQRSYFFRAAAFLRSSFFRTVNFSQLLFQPLLENRKLFRAVTFRNNHFLAEELFRKKDIYRRATFSKQVLLHIINFFRKATFWKKLIIQKSNTLTFSGELPF